MRYVIAAIIVAFALVISGYFTGHVTDRQLAWFFGGIAIGMIRR